MTEYIIINGEKFDIPPNVDWDKTTISWKNTRKSEEEYQEELTRNKTLRMWLEGLSIIKNLRMWIKEIETWENNEDKRILIKDINRRIREINKDL